MVLAPGSRYSESAESDDTRSETSLLTQAVSKQVVSRDFILKVNKKRVVMHGTSSVLSGILPRTKKSMVLLVVLYVSHVFYIKSL